MEEKKTIRPPRHHKFVMKNVQSTRQSSTLLRKRRARVLPAGLSYRDTTPPLFFVRTTPTNSPSSRPQPHVARIMLSASAHVLAHEGVVRQKKRIPFSLSFSIRLVILLNLSQFVTFTFCHVCSRQTVRTLSSLKRTSNIYSRN